MEEIQLFCKFKLDIYVYKCECIFTLWFPQDISSCLQT